MTEVKALKGRFEPWKALVAEIEDLATLQELAEAENDEAQAPEIEAILSDLQKRYDKQNIFELMSGEMDGSGCFLTCTPAREAPKACDWPRCSTACICVGRNGEAIPSRKSTCWRPRAASSPPP
jgi:peptide chain release factor 2